jgi:hypothetical protein
VVAATAAVGACHRSEPPLVTYFHADPALTLRHPPSWTARLAEQEGVRYRYFESQPSGAQRSAVTATLVATKLETGLEEYVKRVLGAAQVQETRDETRGTARGRRVRAATPDGKTRHSLLLLQEGGGVFGLHTQGEAAAFAERQADVDGMEASLAVESASAYPERRNAEWGFALRVPESWRAGRTFSGNGTYVAQYLSPPLAIDKDGQSVHASLTITVESAPPDGSVASFRERSLKKMGDAYQLVDHQDWGDGMLDVLQFETSLAASRSKRFYRTANGRAYGLAFEAREDVFPRVSRWSDLIASTLRVGAEAGS